MVVSGQFFDTTAMNESKHQHANINDQGKKLDLMHIQGIFPADKTRRHPDDGYPPSMV